MIRMLTAVTAGICVGVLGCLSYFVLLVVIDPEREA